MDLDWEMLSWTIHGPQRIAILKVVTKPMSKTQIYREVKARYIPKASRDSIYRTLRGMINKELITCSLGRSKKECKVTNKGMEINKHILDMFKIPSTIDQFHKKATDQGLDIHYNNVSERIEEMVQRGLLKCLTPRRKEERIYQTTEQGEKILKILKYISELE